MSYVVTSCVYFPHSMFTLLSFSLRLSLFHIASQREKHWGLIQRLLWQSLCACLSVKWRSNPRGDDSMTRNTLFSRIRNSYVNTSYHRSKPCVTQDPVAGSRCRIKEELINSSSTPFAYLKGRTRQAVKFQTLPVSWYGLGLISL